MKSEPSAGTTWLPVKAHHSALVNIPHFTITHQLSVINRTRALKLVHKIINCESLPGWHFIRASSFDELKLADHSAVPLMIGNSPATIDGDKLARFLKVPIFRITPPFPRPGSFTTIMGMAPNCPLLVVKNNDVHSFLELPQGRSLRVAPHLLVAPGAHS